MRFRLHGSGSLQGIQIDWDAPVERGPELRAAMADHDVDQMQAGLVRRGYLARAIMYPRGVIALRVAEGHEIFLQVPDEHAVVKAAATVAVATVATVEPHEAGLRHRIVVGDREAGERVDLIIAGAAPTLSRAVVQRLIAEGHVTIGGAPVGKANRRLRGGEVIEVAVARPVDAADQR